ncbi:MAG: ABC transporter substrate-binding protein [Pirellulaceae bacterium]|nr:ABC transporter substrate-binding protein [Pirellulaceae bacterium]
MSRLAIALVAAALLLAPSMLVAVEPLYQQRPYDVVTLDANNGNSALKVQPLDMPVRRLPPSANRTGEIEIELLERPGERFRVAWFNITNLQFFEELVLAEAAPLVAQGKFDEAYEYYRFLETKYPQTAGLREAVENFLWQHSASEFKAGRFDQALALMVELHRRNPRRPNLNTAYGRVTVKLVENRLAAGNYRAARGLLKNLAQRYPDQAATSVAPFESQLQAKATALLVQARADLAANNLSAAHRAAMQVLEVWPAIAGGRELAQAIHAKYPVASVGVISPAPQPPLRPTDDWAALRAERLVYRFLAERTATGYLLPLGEIAKSEGNRGLTLALKPGLGWPDTNRPLSAQEVARCLVARADPGQAAFDAAWSDIFAGANVTGLSAVQIEFARLPVRVESLLTIPLWTSGAAVGGGPRISGLGPYRLAEETPVRTSFVAQTGYFAAQPGQPSEVEERAYADSAAALRALRRGEVSVLDRLSPWDVKRLVGNKDYVVRAYAFPTVHLLVPNPHQPLTANRTFRRALLYALDREGILRRGLLDGQAIAGCEVLSGPFPREVSGDDPHGYANNPQIKPRPYDPGTALVLSRLALDEVRAATGQKIDGQPALTLVHPPEPIARAACQSIARQLGTLDLQIVLREAPADAVPADYDLLYAELAMREPAVDAIRLLGPRGLTGSCSPAMLAALRELESAAEGRQAASQLHAIHRLAAGELPVIPLWQLVEHCAFHAGVQGFSAKPVSLYQDIESWRVPLRLPSE